MKKLKEFIATDGGKQIVFAVVAAVVVIFLVSGAYAEQNHECQGGHNCNGGEGGRTQTNTQAQTTSVRSNSNSSASSNSGNNRLSSTGGQADASSTGGSAESDSVISVNTNTENERSAPSAPTTYADHCSQGASASGLGGSGGIVSRDVLCDHMKVADAMYASWERMRIECETPENPACDYAKEEEYYHAYLENMDAMERIMAQTSITGQVSKTAGQLVLPIGVIWALAFLL